VVMGDPFTSVPPPEHCYNSGCKDINFS
jgi:hypothetical protein